jgi:hypothetical protein
MDSVFLAVLGEEITDLGAVEGTHFQFHGDGSFVVGVPVLHAPTDRKKTSRKQSESKHEHQTLHEAGK